MADPDPRASNVSLYLAALGIDVKSDVVARWLGLIPVICIGLGSALSIIPLNFLAQPKDIPAQPKDNLAQHKDDPAQLPESKETARFIGIERPIQMSQLALRPNNSAPVRPNSNVIPYAAQSKAHTRQSADEEILRQLKLHGSSAVFGAQRQMAFSFGIDRSTFNRAAAALARRGAISVIQDGNRVVMKLPLAG